MLLPKDERRRRLLHYLRNYQALRQAVAELEEDIAGAQLPTPGTLGIAGQGRAARPAERAALRDLTRGDALRAWLAAIDAGMAARPSETGVQLVAGAYRALYDAHGVPSERLRRRRRDARTLPCRITVRLSPGEMAALNTRRGAATVQEYVRALIRRASEEA